MSVVTGSVKESVLNVWSHNRLVHHHDPWWHVAWHIEASLVSDVEIRDKFLHHVVQKRVVVVIEHIDVIGGDLSVGDLSVGNLNFKDSVFHFGFHFEAHLHLQLKSVLVLDGGIWAIELKSGLHVTIFTQDDTWIVSKFDNLLSIVKSSQSHIDIKIDILTVVDSEFRENSQEVIWGQVTIELEWHVSVRTLDKKAIGAGLGDKCLLLEIATLSLGPNFVVLLDWVDLIALNAHKSSIQVQIDQIFTWRKLWVTGWSCVHWELITEWVQNKGVTIGDLAIEVFNLVLDK